MHGRYFGEKNFKTLGEGGLQTTSFMYFFHAIIIFGKILIKFIFSLMNLHVNHTKFSSFPDLWIGCGAGR